MPILNAIKSATPGQIVRDKGTPNSVRGLHLLVNADGSKTFYVYYRTKSGRERRPKIGSYPTMSLQEARAHAKAILNKVAMGEDPQGNWQEARAEMTISDLFDACFEHHWSAPRFQRSGWAHEAKRHFEKNIKPTFGKLKISEVKATDVRQWLEGYKSAIYEGNRAKLVLSKMYNFAIEREWIKQGTNPCAIVKAHKEKKRQRYATAEELRKLGAILGREAKLHPQSVAFIYLLMFTGSRPSAIARARWDQLSTFVAEGKEFGLLKFSGKSSEDSGEDETVLIPPVAMDVIKGLPRNTQTITGIASPIGLWKRICRDIGCEGLWLRDLRRTYATIGLSDGVSVGVIGELLNHKTAQTTKTYAKLMQDAKAEAAATIADKMEKYLKASQSPDKKAI